MRTQHARFLRGLDLIKPPLDFALDHLRGLLTQRPPRRLDAPAPLLRAAVLIPLLRSGDHLEILFTRRTDTVLTHKGQISFPGGQQEDSDRSLIETALRESYEEIGLDPSLVSVIGEMDDMFTSVSGYVVTPVVGLVRESIPELRLAPAEVRSVFTVPIDRLLQVSVHRIESRQLDGRLFEVHFYTVGEDVIWGATGLMLYRFLEAWKDSSGDLSRWRS